MEAKQRGGGEDKWMQVENDKPWQSVGLSQNRTVPRCPTACHSKAGMQGALAGGLPPTPSHVGTGLSLRKGCGCRGLGRPVRTAGGAGRGSAWGRGWLDVKQSTFVCRAGQGLPLPRKVEEGWGRQGPLGQAPEAWPAHGPFPALTAHTDLWTFYLYNGLVSLSLFLCNCPCASSPLIRLLVRHHFKTTNHCCPAWVTSASSQSSLEFFILWFCWPGGFLSIFYV